MFLIFGCKQGDNKSSATDESASLTKLVNDWNNAHNSKDVAVLASLYNESVDYYGRAKDKMIASTVNYLSSKNTRIITSK